MMMTWFSLFFSFWSIFVEQHTVLLDLSETVWLLSTFFVLAKPATQPSNHITPKAVLSYRLLKIWTSPGWMWHYILTFHCLWLNGTSNIRMHDVMSSRWARLPFPGDSVCLACRQVPQLSLCADMFRFIPSTCLRDIAFTVSLPTRPSRRCHSSMLLKCFLECTVRTIRVLLSWCTCAPIVYKCFTL